jgi:hypothetical protein
MLLQDEQTRIDGAPESGASRIQTPASEAEALSPETGKRKLSRNEYRTLLSGAGGVAAGVAGATFTTSFREPPETPTPPEPAATTAETATANSNVAPQPNIVEPETFNIDDVKIASSPDDAMSFNAAFAAARKEVGPGGAFAWRGGVYGTYYANEWDNFSPTYKTSFSNANWRAEFAERGQGERFGNAQHTDVASNSVKTESPTVETDTQNNNEAPVTIAVEDINPALRGHKIHLTPTGIPYVSLTDADTGAEVRLSPFDDDYIVLDPDGKYVGQLDVQSKIEYDYEAAPETEAARYILQAVADEGEPALNVEPQQENEAPVPAVEETSGEEQNTMENALPDYSNDNDVSPFMAEG